MSIEELKAKVEALNTELKALEAKLTGKPELKLWRPEGRQIWYSPHEFDSSGYYTFASHYTGNFKTAIDNYGAFPTAEASKQANESLRAQRAIIKACQQADPEAGPWAEDRRLSPYYNPYDKTWVEGAFVENASSPMYVHTDEQNQLACDILNAEGVKPCV